MLTFETSISPLISFGNNVSRSCFNLLFSKQLLEISWYMLFTLFLYSIISFFCGSLTINCSTFCLLICCWAPPVWWEIRFLMLDLTKGYMYSYGISSFGNTPTTDWLAQDEISSKLTWPNVAPVIAITVVFLGNNFVADLSNPSFVIYSLGFIILKLFTSPELIHGIVPPQYSGLFLLGVPPNLCFP